VTAYFRVTVEDLETGDVQSMQVAAGDYMVIPFEPCYLDRTQRNGNGTVQLTLRKHSPAGPPRHGDTPWDAS
jgi:hypothetical protein